MNEPEVEKRETVRSSYSFSNVGGEIGWTEAQVLKWSLAISAATFAGLLQIYGAKSAAFVPPDGDRTLTEAAKRLAVSTEGAAMQAIDAGLPHLKPQQAWLFRSYRCCSFHRTNDRFRYITFVLLKQRRGRLTSAFP